MSTPNEHHRTDAAATPGRSALELLALLNLPGIGPTKALRAALVTTNYDELIEAASRDWDRALDAANDELETCRRNHVTVLSLFDARYPARLRALHDPPPVLFCHGSIDALDATRSVAVVGTREPTSFGSSATEAITEVLASGGWSVISGLAKGIDTAAHEAALKYRTPTVAVMAGGLDRVYPAENRALAKAILEHGGALVSEQRWGVAPQRSSFVQRNRIQTGLAAAVVVAQTGRVSGTMHTARHAAAQGRPVFCPVPHTDHEKNEGLRLLLNEPARELCHTLPAWEKFGALCKRLGPEPLARPVEKDHFSDFLASLDLALAHASASVPERRWWPEFDPPSQLGARDAVVPDDGQPPLFALAD